MKTLAVIILQLTQAYYFGDQIKEDKRRGRKWYIWRAREMHRR